jgi:hypothetical protein
MSRADLDAQRALLPCPFCGSKNVTICIAPCGYVVECDDCLCRTDYRDTRKSAVESWTTRTPQAALSSQAPVTRLGLSEQQIESLRTDIGAGWMSESGRDALDDWITLQAPPVQQEPVALTDAEIIASFEKAIDNEVSLKVGDTSYWLRKDELLAWVRTLPLVAPSPQGDADDGARLDAFAGNKNWELGMDWDAEDLEWCVWKVVGSRNDREWIEIGRGNTPHAAIDAARKVAQP